MLFCSCLVLVKPEQLTFVANKRTVCQDEVFNFNCSAFGKPPIHTYEFYENDTLMRSSSSGVWNRTMSSGGVFIYKCVANNTAGTANITETVTVNGKLKPSYTN